VTIPGKRDWIFQQLARLLVRKVVVDYRLAGVAVAVHTIRQWRLR
jgi:hypothetical protein